MTKVYAVIKFQMTSEAERHIQDQYDGLDYTMPGPHPGTNDRDYEEIEYGVFKDEGRALETCKALVRYSFDYDHYWGVKEVINHLD